MKPLALPSATLRVTPILAYPPSERTCLFTNRYAPSARCSRWKYTSWALLYAMLYMTFTPPLPLLNWVTKRIGVIAENPFSGVCKLIEPCGLKKNPIFTCIVSWALDALGIQKRKIEMIDTVICFFIWFVLVLARDKTVSPLRTNTSRYQRSTSAYVVA